MDHKKPEETENHKDIITLSIPQVDDKSIKVHLFDVAENQGEDHLVTGNHQLDEEWEALDNLVSFENRNKNFMSFDNNQNTCTIGGNLYLSYLLYIFMIKNY